MFLVQLHEAERVELAARAENMEQKIRAAEEDRRQVLEEAKVAAEERWVLWNGYCCRFPVP